MPKDMDGNELAVGDTVTWESQAAGSWTQKTGTVIYAGKPITYGQLLPYGVRKAIRNGTAMFDTVSAGVVVRVPGRSPKAKPKFYAPRLTNLRLKVNA